MLLPTLIPFPSPPQNYWECDCGAAIVRSCPAGDVFSPDERRCLPSSAVPACRVAADDRSHCDQHKSADQSENVDQSASIASAFGYYAS